MSGELNKSNDILKDAKLRKRRRLLKTIFSFRGLVVAFILFLVVLLFLNKQITALAEKIDKQGTFTFSAVMKVVAERTKEFLRMQANIDPGFLMNNGKILRRTRLGDIYAKYTYSVIYRGNVRIAEFKETDKGVYDLVGEIPDGEAEFIDLSIATYGVEYYKNNKREGGYYEYFQGNNKLRLRGLYFRGKLLSGKEYNYDGSLRFEYKNMEKVVPNTP